MKFWECNIKTINFPNKEFEMKGGAKLGLQLFVWKRT